jgi:hypothetical protein
MQRTHVDTLCFPVHITPFQFYSNCRAFLTGLTLTCRCVNTDRNWTAARESLKSLIREAWNSVSKTEFGVATHGNTGAKRSRGCNGSKQSSQLLATPSNNSSHVINAILTRINNKYWGLKDTCSLEEKEAEMHLTDRPTKQTDVTK